MSNSFVFMLNNIYNTLFCSVLLLFAWGKLQAQSPIGIEPLRSNPGIVAQQENSPKVLHTAGSKFYFYDDTLSLPFVDDFSKNLFKDFRLEQYTGIYADTLHYFRMDTGTYFEAFPDSIWYVFTQPDSFVITSQDTFQVVPSQAPQLTIYIYDTLNNPYHIIETIQAWKFIPKMIDVVAGQPVYSTDFVPDGTLYNKEKIYTIVPASPNDKSLWVDKHVYINDGIAVKPPSIGVAVFDGIAMNGLPYNYSAGARGIADYLTSKPIDLSSYLPGDSVYLSFYIQPQGLGFYPESRDTFVLEFKSPSSDSWHWVWSKKGSPLTGFEHVRIPLLNAAWFQKGFQFRFKNYANLDANADHWLLDYVRLDANRNVNDTLFNDVTFITRAPSILLNYEQMPARQLIQEEVNQKWTMQTANLWNQCKNITYGHTTFDANGVVITSYPAEDSPGSYDTSCVNTYYPGELYNNNFRHYLPSFTYEFDVQDPNCCPYQDNMLFTVRHVIQNLTNGTFPTPGVLTYDQNTGNDTVYRYQRFENFYAYDDGEAEASMYLGTVGQIAYEFELNFPDTLRAIQIYFSPQNPNVSNNSFELRVWQTLNNTSEDTVYAEASLYPIYNEGMPNRFTTYILNREVVLPAGKFYIGWRQNTQFKMNVGYDKNIDRKDKMFYKTTGEWLSFADLSSTQYDGSMMMRPVLGSIVTPDDFVGIAEEEIVETEVNVYPNPSTGVYYYSLNTAVPQDLEIQVVDLSGKIVATQRGNASNSIDISQLNNGIYFTRFVSKSQSLLSVHKLILSK